MPTPYIEKLHKQGKGSINELEKLWKEAKDVASKKGKADDYALIMTIFKEKVKSKKK